ncbi:hypothetical protein GE107_14320 [Cohnella sp. CFH 77786]|uniref:hypothetical protein n=1 Tax=Cohnella sp. CFH 77786 TaxID=2662265 RepID=UPI001C60D9AC|nr:hypothetical protein [Cohnella sp. CFH 77786]MBW5447228.1 hypothetical protein [Cohnella sp. CFH 77786]
MARNDRFVVYTIRFSTIKKIMIFDLVAGTGLYYVLKLLSAGWIISTAGSAIGSMGLKRLAERLPAKAGKFFR